MNREKKHIRIPKYKFSLKFLSIFFLVLLFVGCSTVPKPVDYSERLVQLEQELANWQSFKITGICEGQIGILSGRYQCVIAKTPDRMRVDVVSSGIFGIGGGTLFAAYIDSEQMQYRLPTSSSIEVKPLNEDISTLYRLVTHYLSNLERKVKDEIVQSLQYNVAGATISFTDDMKIKQISSPEDKTQIDFVYNRQGDLQDIQATLPQIRNLKVQINRIDRENVMVQPLVVNSE